MVDFTIRFFICNIFIDPPIGIILAARHFFQKSLTSRSRYHLWFILLGLLAVPFFNIQPPAFHLKFPSAIHLETAMQTVKSPLPSSSLGWMNDFSISVKQNTPSAFGFALPGIWLSGILVLLFFLIKAQARLHRLKQSALPLQNENVRRLYQNCRKEMGIRREIPIYSTAFLKSPVITGLFLPEIYLPIHLISDYSEEALRYMLLHELQHYRHKDALVNYLMNLAGILYWFNPLVWYALKEMKNDREIACDTSVLHMLRESDYENYGHTLIDLAEKISFTPFPFSTGIGGNMTQMKKRILNITAYRPLSFRKKLRSGLTFVLIAVLLLGFIPVLSIRAADQNYYHWDKTDKNIAYIDLSSDFEGYNGSFVLYDAAADSWQIYNQKNALTRIPPASTYKIFIALSGLESGIIRPNQSEIAWNGQEYPYDSWNKDQTLETAMQNSVTWYFQTIDRQSDLSSIQSYIRKIGYGNQTVQGDISSYWFDSLKISPVEQIEMLQKLYYNELNFSPENIETVKHSIHLFSTADSSFYGKTGTETVNNEYSFGWFTGFLEKSGHTYFFAANIQNESDAAGPAAARLTLSVLSELGLN